MRHKSAMQVALTATITNFLFAPPLAMALENTKVLPKGVRNLNIRTVSAKLGEKTNAAGERESLAEPLIKDVSFRKIAQDEPALKATQLKGILLASGFDENQAVGNFTADLKGHVGVTAGVMSFGLSDKVTVAVAVPYYRARTAIAVGFRPHETAQRFLNTLASSEYNLAASAREAGEKLNQATVRLNDKLVDHGYRALDDWQAQGLGDMTLAAKARVFDEGIFKAATTSGVVAPTGRVDDPDILTDVAFGDGQWDVFGQLAVDEELSHGFVLNQYAKYTAQLPGRRVVREATDEEEIDVAKKTTRFSLGDKVDAGLSLAWEPGWGLVTGIGYNWFRKFGARFHNLEVDARAKMQRGSDQSSRTREMMLGYSTVPLYQRGAFAVPVEMKLTYLRQEVSRNMPVMDMAQFDLNLFF